MGRNSSLYKGGDITKHVEKYKKDTQHDHCVTPTRFMSIDYLYNFVFNNVEVKGKSFKLQEVLIVYRWATKTIRR